jgi:hypothetical protein
MIRDKEYFEEIKKTSILTLIAGYDRCLAEYNSMFEKAGLKQAQGKPISQNHLKKMRKKSLELEKFGLIFRARTIKSRVKK